MRSYAIDDVRMEEIEGQKITGARLQCHVRDGRSLKKAGCLPDCLNILNMIGSMWNFSAVLKTAGSVF